MTTLRTEGVNAILHPYIFKQVNYKASSSKLIIRLSPQPSIFAREKVGPIPIDQPNTYKRESLNIFVFALDIPVFAGAISWQCLTSFEIGYAIPAIYRTSNIY